MLIRLANDDLVEYPDELGALVLAEPIHGDVPDFSLEELNCVINCNLGMIFDDELTLEQNIDKAREFYSMWGQPDAANLEKALALVKQYTENIALKDIGYIDKELLNDFYGIQSNRPRSTENVIAQEMHEVGNVAELGDSTKLLANEPALATKP